MTLENHGDPWSNEDEERLRDRYPEVAATELVEEFGRTHEALKAKAKELGIQKGDEWKGSGEAVSEEALSRGVDAEQKFEELAEERGWEYFENTIFLRFGNILADSKMTGIGNLDELQEKIEEKPKWFRELREEVTEALTHRDSHREFFPDYVVGDREDGPLFVEVKYGSSNLMKVQIEFFEFLQENEFEVYIFRVKPSGEIDFSEWDGGWK
jgi:hypothetical protein